ncbi:MAG: tRNA-specific 2-thiouridylase MnmA [Oligoflexia bacterium]|nr:MAG: tRNA-specific 2-thiouridylase MnmA [Oligoflexia bacterium]
MSEVKSKGRVLVAMSGGVDSSVAAALLVEQGYEVIGATMQVWDYSSCDLEEGNGTCCSSIDVDDARAVADKLNIPFYVLNCEAKFKAQVIDPFIAAYLQGTTPLPCVDCNTYLKFDHLIRKMKELECDYLATGHYAQIVHDQAAVKILTSTDDWKDQTYFLFSIDKTILPHLLFPIGHMKKPQVREYAEAKGLINAKKRDSTGICFVGNQGYGNFVQAHANPEELKKKKGFIRRYPSGEKMAPHDGIHLFTIGQSKGLGMDFHEKLYVIKIDPVTNTVWVGDEKHLYGTELYLKDLHLLDEISPDEKLDVKIRYSVRGSPARVEQSDKGIKVVFDEPQRAITPGQACVLYRGKQLVGGGWIYL